MLYCSERANTHIEHGAKGAYREIRSYNRYLQPTGIIKECIQQVLSQTVPFSYICIVDNHSTDGTSEYLDQLAAGTETVFPNAGKPEFHILHLPENIGGAGGFAKGLEDLGKQTVTGS